MIVLVICLLVEKNIQGDTNASAVMETFTAGELSKINND